MSFNEFEQLTLAGANCQNVVEGMLRSDPYYQRLAEQQKKTVKVSQKQQPGQKKGPEINKQKKLPPLKDLQATIDLS